VSARGTCVAIVLGVREKLYNVPYNFPASWWLSRRKFELYTLGALAVIIAFGIVGYITGAGVRRQIVEFEGDRPEPAAPVPAM